MRASQQVDLHLGLSHSANGVILYPRFPLCPPRVSFRFILKAVVVKPASVPVQRHIGRPSAEAAFLPDGIPVLHPEAVGTHLICHLALLRIRDRSFSLCRVTITRRLRQQEEFRQVSDTPCRGAACCAPTASPGAPAGCESLHGASDPKGFRKPLGSGGSALAGSAGFLADWAGRPRPTLPHLLESRRGGT